MELSRYLGCMLRDGVDRTPVLYLFLDVLKKKYELLSDYLEDVLVFYAVKANDDLRVLRYLNRFVSGFEVASCGELRKVLEMGVGSNRIISSNPVKTLDFIKLMYDAGVEYLVVDGVGEVDKIRRFYRRAKVIIRVRSDGRLSAWGLGRKFGAHPSDIPQLYRYIVSSGFEFAGFMFHAGSQVTNPVAFLEELRKVEGVMKALGISEVEVLNIGGGFPASHSSNILNTPTFYSDFLTKVRGFIDLFGFRVSEFWVEPGRFLVGDAGFLVSRVVGVERRGRGRHVHIDVGVYNGLFEAVGKMPYHVIPLSGLGGGARCVVWGPTCDSVDIVSRDARLPRDVAVGDLVVVWPAGAYTITTRTYFNGFEPFDVKFVEGVV